MKMRVGILTSGGDCPGLNATIRGVAKALYQRMGDKVEIIGILNGYDGLINGNYRVMAPDEFSGILTVGGTILGTKRTPFKMMRVVGDDKVDKVAAMKKTYKDAKLDCLLCLGGNGTHKTANLLSQEGLNIIGLPKTIDNDLPLPKGTPTFGYESAKDKGAVIARAVYVDARTSGNWFVLAAMGRSAGHLAFGIGEACHYPMIVIPEMFDKTEITVEKIVNLVISSIIKRKIMGMDYGATVISEGVFHALSDEEIRKSGIHFTYDEHGHPELGKVSKAHIFNEMIEKKLKEIGLKVKSRPVELGYEIRCQTPIAYDLTYCSELGIGVHKLFAEGKTGCMVYVDSEGNVNPLYLKDLQDPTTGKIPPRLVDIKSDKFSSVVDNIINAITPADYEAAKQYVSNPEEYDFHKILNWK